MIVETFQPTLWDLGALASAMHDFPHGLNKTAVNGVEFWSSNRFDLNSCSFPKFFDSCHYIQMAAPAHMAHQGAITANDPCGVLHDNLDEVAPRMKSTASLFEEPALLLGKASRG